MDDETRRLSMVILDKNAHIAKLEKMIRDQIEPIRQWENAYKDQEKMIAFLNEKHRNECLRQVDALNIANAQRDAFKEALQIIVRCKK